MKIDIFNHFLPQAYLEAVDRLAGSMPLVIYSKTIRALWDMEERLRMIAAWPDLRQVIALGQPTPEVVAGPEASPALARLANDGMAEIRDRWPDHFPAFVASLPMNNVPAALAELDRAVEDLGAVGVQISTSIDGRPLDHPEFFPLFERIASHHGVPVWLHPFRGPQIPEYPAEAQSEYEIYTVLGWPHESSVAMARIVFSEMFDKLPDLRIITHHCGATIPYLLGRVGPMWDELGQRTQNERYMAIIARMKAKAKRPIDYFREFHADTVVGGSTAALRCGLDFFGPGHIIFASDFPYGPEGGLIFLRENIRAVEDLGLEPQDRDGIYFANAEKLLCRTGHGREPEE